MKGVGTSAAMVLTYLSENILISAPDYILIYNITVWIFGMKL